MRRTAMMLALLVLCATGPFCRGAVTPTRTIVVHAHRFTFEPAEITVKSGETVQLQLFSDDVPHSLLIKGLGINQEVTKAHPVVISLTGAHPGDYPGRCGRFCGGGHGHMIFTVHVTGN
jgi:cytochrome c oxidase subunit II